MNPFLAIGFGVPTRVPGELMFRTRLRLERLENREAPSGTDAINPLDAPSTPPPPAPAQPAPTDTSPPVTSPTGP